MPTSVDTGRFVFSEGYLKSVGSDLALNILCAVANPLGAEGMLRIVRGALKSRDLTKDLKSVALPIVLVQVRLKLVHQQVVLQSIYQVVLLRRIACGNSVKDGVIRSHTTSTWCSLSLGALRQS